MKILVINQFFWPDMSATSQLLTDLAKGLAERGHEVYAISADTGYNAASADAPPAGIQIHRVRTSRFSRGRVGRIVSYLSFYVSAALRALTLPRPDLVLTLTTPPLISLVGTMLKALRGSRHFIWEMDVYPDVAIDLNYFKAGGMIDRVTGTLADYSRRHADGIIALGECMKQRLMGRGVDAGRIFVADNWADGNAIQPMPRPGDPGQLVLLYSGNLGLAHDLETLTGAMLALEQDELPEERNRGPRFHFLFVGSGGRRQELEAFVAAHDLRSVELRPYVERTSLGESLAAGDIGLVTQRDVCCGSVVPSKVYGLLAAGRPILFIGPRQATPALIIDRFQCGWQIDCGDVPGLTRLLIHLSAHPTDVSLAGRNARQAFLHHYDLPLGIERIAGILGASVPGYSPSLLEPVLSAQS
jgi:glycosyltransferase involved in cell wall biosynthesis